MQFNIPISDTKHNPIIQRLDKHYLQPRKTLFKHQVLSSKIES